MVMPFSGRNKYVLLILKDFSQKCLTLTLYNFLHIIFQHYFQ